MSVSPLEDAFAHHVWATLELLETCQVLVPEQLESPVPGTYGSILATLQHLVGADARYLFTLSSGRAALIGEDRMDLGQLRAQMIGHRGTWGSVLSAGLDPGAVLERRREDGSETHAPVSIRLAQALQHGNDHRSQVCTALSGFGVTPPDIDVWAFGALDGRVIEVPPTGG